LIRPRQPRVLAGVSGALARATNTDPILWRVIFIALAFFAGFGVVAYLVLWLATPADGDSASPVEALFGRGRSSTSPALTVIAGVVTLLLLGGATDNWHIAVIGAIVVAVVLIASNRNRANQAGAPAAYPPVAPAA
jgi:phage shock protein PspC (stress-responsive transcriptional regulator)